MKSFKLYGSQDLRAEETDLEENEGQVVIKVNTVGICGSDIHYYMHGRCGVFVPKTPFSLGHEFSGIVTSTPENDKGIKVGDRVAVDPLLNCGDIDNCEYCAKGQRSLCSNKKFMGSAAAFPHVQGAMREEMTAPIANTHLLPDSVSFVEGAMIEPTAVCLHAVKKAGDLHGKKVLVAGGGTIGQLILRIAISKGADVDLSDIKAYSLDIAKKGGATKTINPAEEQIEDMTYDVVFEAAGAAPAFASALSSVKKGGTIVQVGTLPDTIEIPGNLIMTKELTVVGTLQFGSEFAESIELIGSGKLSIADLNTHSFNFDQTPEALEFASKGEDCIKVQINL
jgi:L-idonate 5-dehydrogenase